MNLPTLATTPDSHAVPSRGKALVVDDEVTSRLILQAQLCHENYQVFTAATGQEAISQFKQQQPDIIFLDVMLPDLYGYEVARQIKRMAGEHFVPIIFLTGLSSEEALVECVEAGGDDFLSKPFSFSILKAKVEAIERIRDLYEKARIQHQELNRLHARMQYEQDIAEQVLSGAVMSANVAEPPVQRLLRPASTFNGDLFISAYTPSGGLVVLLGDFTGHGLAAAMGALPVSETFRAMIAGGFSLSEAMAAINRKLYRLLPTGMFLAAAALHIEPGLRAAMVWNSGLPDVILRGWDGVRRRVRSQHPPLGALVEFLPGCSPELLDLQAGDAFLLCSDGVTEACNRAGEMFGDERFERVLTAFAPQHLFAAVSEALDEFVDGAEQADDISLAVVPCVKELFAPPLEDIPSVPSCCCPSGSDWSWSLALHGNNLGRIDPVPLVMNQLQAFGVPIRHRQQLFVVATELFSNALEHGVLGLKSICKDTGEGFLAYYIQRQQALEALHTGYVRMEISYRCDGIRGALLLRVEDSGKGFDHQARMQATSAELNVGKSGRGITLLCSICRNITYFGDGNRVEAEYVL